MRRLRLASWICLSSTRWPSAPLSGPRTNSLVDNRSYLKEIQPGPLDVPPLTLVHGSLLDEDQYLVDLEDALENFPWLGIP